MWGVTPPSTSHLNRTYKAVMRNRGCGGIDKLSCELLLAFLYMVVGRCNNVLLVDVRLLSVGVDKRFFCKMVYFLIPLIDNHNYTHSGKNTDSYRYRSEQMYLEQCHKTKFQYFKQKTASIKMYPFWLVKGLLLLSKRGTFAY